MENCCKRPFIKQTGLLHGGYRIVSLYNNAYKYEQTFAKDFMFADIFASKLQPIPIQMKLVCMLCTKLFTTS